MTRSGTILIVEDDADDLYLMLRALRRLNETISGSGFDFVTASDGAEALAIINSRPLDFDVLITDRKMPRMNGLELLQRVKSNPQTTGLPVILVTAAAEREEIVEGIDAGAYYYMVKPVDNEMLAAMVNAAVLDFDRFRELQRQVTREAGTLALMYSGTFGFRSPEEATNLGTFLAKACPDPERVVVGLTELLLNAVEHGNLEISYSEKSALNRSGCFEKEIDIRLSSEAYASRIAIARFERTEEEVVIAIRDQGKGFDPAPFLYIDPKRVFDSHGRGIAIANLLSFDGLEYHDGGREVMARITL